MPQSQPADICTRHIELQQYEVKMHLLHRNDLLRSGTDASSRVQPYLQQPAHQYNVATTIPPANAASCQHDSEQCNLQVHHAV
jgi:hypothetical protein